MVCKSNRLIVFAVGCKYSQSILKVFLLASSHLFVPDEDDTNDKTLMYYVNDGVYGSFNCILYDHAHVKPILQKVCILHYS